MAISFVNVAEAYAGSSALLLTPATSHVAGNSLVVFVSAVNEDVSGITDVAGNTYISRGTSVDGTTSFSAWTAIGILGSAINVLSIALTGSGIAVCAFVQQFSASLGTLSFYDFRSGTAASGTSLSTANSPATTQANAVIAAAGRSGATGQTYTAGANFTLRGSGVEVGDVRAQSETRIVSAMGTYNAAMTNTVSDHWGMNHIILQETLSGRSPNQFMALLGVGR